jgi:hypothetical protein
MESQKNQEYLKICKQIFKAFTHEYLVIWLKDCNQNEIKGIKVILAVIKHQGQKKFRPSHLQVIRNEAKEIRTRTMTSFYTSDYCLESSASPVTCDIFNHAKLSELSYSSVLNYETLIYLQRWIDLKDEPKYQLYLLDALKGLNSVINTNKKTLTTTNDSAFSTFLSKKQIKNTTSVQPAKFNYDRRHLSSLKARPLPDSYKKISQSSNLGKFQPMFYENRMKKIMKGTEGLLKWIYDKNESNYQENFIGKFSRTQTFKPLLASSVIKLMP